jgi:hypothetical protein
LLSALTLSTAAYVHARRTLHTQASKQARKQARKRARKHSIT